MITDQIDLNLKFSNEMKKYLDENFDKMFSEAVTTQDVDFSDIDGDIIDVEQENGEINILVSERKIKNRITAAIIEDRVQNQLFLIEYNASKNTVVGGYQ